MKKKHKGGPLDFHYITPEQYIKECEKDGVAHESLEELKRRAKLEGICENCDLPIWKLANTGMCFPCTTGESDASNDYELS